MIVHKVKNDPLFRVVSSTLSLIFTPILHKSGYKLGGKRPLFLAFQVHSQKNTPFLHFKNTNKTQFLIISFSKGNSLKIAKYPFLYLEYTILKKNDIFFQISQTKCLRTYLKKHPYFCEILHAHAYTQPEFSDPTGPTGPPPPSPPVPKQKNSTPTIRLSKFDILTGMSCHINLEHYARNHV